METLSNRLPRRFVALPCFLLLCAGLFAADGHDDHVWQRVGAGAVDWTSFTVHISTETPFMPDHPDSPQQKTVVLAKARLLARKVLYQTLLRINLDNGSALDSTVAENDRLQEALQNRLLAGIQFVEPPAVTGKATITMRLALPLKGKGRLLESLLPLFPHNRLIPQTKLTNAVYNYSGLVLDARHLAFNPSLATRLLDESGRVLYGPSFTNRDRFVQAGHILFLSRLTSPRVKQRAGQRFFYAHAKELKPASSLKNRWKYGTDLVLFQHDARRLLASDSTRRRIRNCAVVVLCRSQ